MVNNRSHINDISLLGVLAKLRCLSVKKTLKSVTLTGALYVHERQGFALWPSKASTFNVGNISWRAGKGDVVQEYVTAFRAKGLKPGLYYSLWDSTQNNGSNGALSAAQMQYIKTQLDQHRGQCRR